MKKCPKYYDGFLKKSAKYLFHGGPKLLWFTVATSLFGLTVWAHHPHGPKVGGKAPPLPLPVSAYMANNRSAVFYPRYLKNYIYCYQTFWGSPFKNFNFAHCDQFSSRASDGSTKNDVIVWRYVLWFSVAKKGLREALPRLQFWSYRKLFFRYKAMQN